MKKLLVLFAISFFSLPAVAQHDTVVVDTVHYYFNKFYFKTGKGLDQLPAYKAAFATSTVASHVGSIFQNSDSIDVFGLEAFVTRNGSSTWPTVLVHLYLCKVENNVPVMPPIDSVAVMTQGNSEDFVTPVGGNFTDNRVHRVGSDFAVLLRNMSTSGGDTVLVGRTNGAAPGNSIASPEDFHGEGLGVVRIMNEFHSTMNFKGRGFGEGTDYEFCIAPRVQYTLTSDHALPDRGTSDGNPVCVFEPMTFTSHSTKLFLRRQFNLVEFVRYWNHNPPFKSNTLKIDKGGPQPEDVFTSDSSIYWYFAPEDNLLDQPHPRIFLPFTTTNNQITFYTDSAARTVFTDEDSTICFTTNEYRTRFKTMALFGRGNYYAYNDLFTLCTSFCNKGTRVGIGENRSFPGLAIFPNPGKDQVSITGLQKGAEIRVFDLVGRQLLLRNAEGDRSELDFSAYAPGTYLIRVSDGGESRTLRFVRQ